MMVSHFPKEGLREKLESRLRVTPGCWIWTGGRDSKGYGGLFVDGAKCKAHRVSYEIYVGSIPFGLHVLHKCDNPACVNPDHLFCGTHAENMRDKALKKRAQGAHRGVEHHLAKLTPQKVALIRQDPRPNSEIARELGVSPKTVYDVRARKSWAYL
jgi:hypothetical protein